MTERKLDDCVCRFLSSLRVDRKDLRLVAMELDFKTEAALFRDGLLEVERDDGGRHFAVLTNKGLAVIDELRPPVISFPRLDAESRAEVSCASCGTAFHPAFPAKPGDVCSDCAKGQE